MNKLGICDAVVFLRPPSVTRFQIVKAVFQLRVFYTYVHARKSLNSFQYYI